MENVTGIDKQPIKKLGDRPIHDAAKYGSPEVVKYFMENVSGIAKEPENYAGDRPVHLAAYYGKFEAIKYLMENVTLDSWSAVNSFNEKLSGYPLPLWTINRITELLDEEKKNEKTLSLIE